MKSCGICVCGKALFAVTNDAGQKVGETHVGEDDDHHLQVLGSMHVRVPQGTPDVSQTDMCVCGHIRGSHMNWPSSTDCLGGPDHNPCACDSFHDVSG